MPFFHFFFLPFNKYGFLSFLVSAFQFVCLLFTTLGELSVSMPFFHSSCLPFNKYIFSFNCCPFLSIGMLFLHSASPTFHGNMYFPLPLPPFSYLHSLSLFIPTFLFPYFPSVLSFAFSRFSCHHSTPPPLPPLCNL